MKLIDLFNEIAKGKKYIKFIVDDMIFIYKDGFIKDEEGEEIHWSIYESWLNEKVEIIEEEKEIEKLNENNTNVLTNIIENRKKINEIIDAVNEIRKEK